jgi:hypothetical protein
VRVRNERGAKGNRQREREGDKRPFSPSSLRILNLASSPLSSSRALALSLPLHLFPASLYASLSLPSSLVEAGGGAGGRQRRETAQTRGRAGRGW